MPSLNTGNAILSNPIKVDSSYNVGIGGAASGSYKLQVTGTTNLTGALTGTSGTLSSSLGVNSTIRSTGQTDPASGVGMELFYRAADTSSYIQSYDRTNGAWKDVRIYGNNLYFGTQGTNNLTIASTGAATFSSSIAATNATFKVNADRNLAIKYDTHITLSGQSDSGAPESLRVYADTFRLFTATTAAGLTERLTVTNGGNVGIGTSSPSSKLEVGDLANVSGVLNDILITGDKVNANGYYARLMLKNSSQSGGSSASIRGERETTNLGTALTFYTNSTAGAGDGTERMRITSGGNVGIGTSSPNDKLDVVSGKIRVSSTTNTLYYGTIEHDAASTGANIYNSVDSGGHIFQTNSTERMRITSGGDTELVKTNIAGITNSTSNTLRFRNTQTNGQSVILGTIYTTSPGSWGGDMVFTTHPANGSPDDSTTERMRITSGGSVCINSTSPLDASAKLNVSGNVYLGATASGAGNSTLKYNTGTGLVSFDTSARIFKKDIIDLEYGLDAVLKMSSKKYKWKSNDNEDLGFIADEMYNVVPEVVYLADNKINKTELEDGEPMGINYDRLVPILVKAIQEQQAQIEAQQQQINSLINR